MLLLCAPYIVLKGRALFVFIEWTTEKRKFTFKSTTSSHNGAGESAHIRKCFENEEMRLYELSIN